MKDCRDIEIGVGAIIAYPGRSGSSVWMNFGRVDAVEEGVGRRYAADYEPARLRVTRIERKLVANILTTTFGKSVVLSNVRNVVVLGETPIVFVPCKELPQ